MSRKLLRRLCVGMLAVCASLGLPGVALAEPNQEQLGLAKQLFEQALAEMDAHSYAPACRKLENVTQILPEALGAQLTLAECYEGLGKLASAWRQYALAEKLAVKVRDQRRIQKARTRAGELEPSLATLTIKVSAALASLEGLSIKRDGEVVIQAEWGVAIPVDVGMHRIEVNLPGQDPWTVRVKVASDGISESVVLKLPQEARRPGTSALAEGTVANAGAKEPAGASKRKWQKPLGWNLMAAGGLGVGVGAVLGALAIGRYDESNNGHCNEMDNFCRTQKGVDLREEALMFGDASTVAFVAGGAFLVGGLVLVLTSPSRAEKPAVGGAAAHRDGTWVRVGAGSVVVGGVW